MFYSSVKLTWNEIQKLGRQLNDILQPAWRVRPISTASRREFNASLKVLFDWCEQTQPSDWKERWGIPAVAIQYWQGMGKLYINTPLKFWQDLKDGLFTHGQLRLLARFVLSMATGPNHPEVAAGRLQLNETWLSYKRAVKDVGLSTTNYGQILRPLKEKGYLVDTGRRHRSGTIIKRVVLDPEKPPVENQEPRQLPKRIPKPRLVASH
jgi:hypothetical protein